LLSPRRQNIHSGKASFFPQFPLYPRSCDFEFTKPLFRDVLPGFLETSPVLIQFRPARVTTCHRNSSLPPVVSSSLSLRFFGPRFLVRSRPFRSGHSHRWPDVPFYILSASSAGNLLPGTPLPVLFVVSLLGPMERVTSIA